MVEVARVEVIEDQISDEGTIFPGGNRKLHVNKHLLPLATTNAEIMRGTISELHRHGIYL